MVWCDRARGRHGKTNRGSMAIIGLKVGSRHTQHLHSDATETRDHLLAFGNETLQPTHSKNMANII